MTEARKKKAPAAAKRSKKRQRTKRPIASASATTTRSDTVDEKRSPARLPPVKEKIGESPDTLRRRAEWFRRRTGTGAPKKVDSSKAD